MAAPTNITIKEVAKHAGVSIATVSRFLNNPTSLKAKNLKKVEQAVKELNYQPQLFARRLAGGKLNTYGLIIPGYEDIFYSFYAMEILRGIASALEKKDIDLYLNIFWNKDHFKTSFIDGVIFADIISNQEQLKRLKDLGIPIVVINHRFDDPKVSNVVIDNFRGAYEAVEFLIHHGHKKIIHFAGDLRVQCANERYEGFKAAMQKNSLEVNNKAVKITNFSRKETRDHLEEILINQNMPTAIFCCSDEIASEVLSFCEEKKIVVPKDLSIIGFDDNPHCLYGNLMLTTVRQPLRKMAALGVEILQDMIEKNAPAQKVVLPTELVIRDTVNFF